MSDELLEAYEIHDEAIRDDVVRLQAEFSNESLESCYFWYLYHHSDYNEARTYFVNDRSSPSSFASLDVGAERTHVENVSLGVFPAEIWQIISTQLAFRELAALRLTNSGLADISAESMVRKVRFDLSFESLERLRFIAGHKHLRKGVKTLAFEAGLLGTIGCIHHYSSHFDLDHHRDFKPLPPAEGQSTPQAQRLYMRNMAKFEKELNAKYAEYRKAFEAQERLLNGPKEFLFQCIGKFPHVQEIAFATDQCRHLLSERFLERYGQDCAVPMAIDPSQTPWELQNILRPGIKRLRARQISSKFFDGKAGRSKRWLESTFKNLDDLSLQFLVDVSSRQGEVAPLLRNANLSHAIGTATNLRTLLVNFSTSASVGHLRDIMPSGKSLSKLHDLNIESFVSTEKDLLEMLKLQPVLKYLELSDVTLSTGNWRNLLRRMRQSLKLKSFVPGGMLSDDDVDLYTDHYSTDAWRDGDKFTLSVTIDSYVTNGFSYIERDEYDGDQDAFERCWNPVYQVEDGDFMPYEELVDLFGPIDSSDDEDELEDGDNDLDDDLDSDTESMQTANETMGEVENGDKMTDGQSNGNIHVTDSEEADRTLVSDVSPSPMDVD